MREDGIGGLFRGAMPTATRAMALNMGMLASNDQAKETLESMGLGKQASTLGGAFIAGFFASACRFVCARESVNMQLFYDRSYLLLL